jgi:hypothetical protein
MLHSGKDFTPPTAEHLYRVFPNHLMLHVVPVTGSPMPSSSSARIRNYNSVCFSEVGGGSTITSTDPLKFSHGKLYATSGFDHNEQCLHEPWSQRWGVLRRGMIRLWDWIWALISFTWGNYSTSLMCKLQNQRVIPHLCSHQLDQGTYTFHQTAAQELLECQASTRQIKCNIVSVSVQQRLNLYSIILDLHSFSLVNIPIYYSWSSTASKFATTFLLLQTPLHSFGTEAMRGKPRVMQCLCTHTPIIRVWGLCGCLWVVVLCTSWEDLSVVIDHESKSELSNWFKLRLFDMLGW